MEVLSSCGSFILVPAEKVLVLNIKDLNIADYFSLYRVIAAPILIGLMFLDQRLWFTWLLLFSYSTDMIDGFLARHLHITSSRGSILDSVGDQLTFAVALSGLLYFEFAFVFDQIWYIGIAVILYLAQSIVALRKYGKLTSFHTYSAKLSAFLQGIFILWTLFFGPVYFLFYTMITVGVIETIEEMILIRMYDNWVSDVKGIYWALTDPRRKG